MEHDRSQARPAGLGAGERELAEAIYRARQRLRRLPRMSPGPRDVRKGDRWLPWHFRGRGRGGSSGGETS